MILLNLITYKAIFKILVMKTIIFVLLLNFFFSCKQDNEPYLSGYEKFRPDVEVLLKSVSGSCSDSISSILDNYNTHTLHLSCVACLIEISEFGKVKGFCKRHPESLANVLEGALRDTGFNLAFIALFKELYPVEFQKLLDKEGVVLIPKSEITIETPEWIKYKEYTLPFEAYVSAYLNLMKM